MSKRNIKCNKHSSKEDNSSLGKLEDEGEPGSGVNPMLRLYLDGGQPDFTDRLVHGQPTLKKTKIKRLKTIMKSIEHTLMKPSSEQRADSSEAMDTTTSVDEAKAVPEDRSKEG